MIKTNKQTSRLMVRHLNPVRTGAGDESPGARVLLLDKDTVAAGDRAPGPGAEGDSQLRTPHVLPKKRRDTAAPGPSFIQALSGCPSIEGYSKHTVPPPSGYSAGADPPQLGGLAGGGGASSSRGTNGHRPSPILGSRRGPTVPHPGDATAPTLLFPGNQRVPTLPRPGEPAGADPPPPQGRNGRRPSSWGRNSADPPLPEEPTGAEPPPSRGPSGCPPIPGARWWVRVLLFPGNQRAPTLPRLGDPVSVRPPPSGDPHGARPLPPGDSLPLARRLVSGPPCAQRPRSPPPPEPTGPRCVLTVVAMVRPAPRLAHQQLTETQPDGGPPRPQPPQSADGGPAPARP